MGAGDTMAGEKSTISIKLGNAEFSAEGPVNIVQAQFEAFLRALESRPGEAGKPDKPDSNGGQNRVTAELDSGLLNRVFAKDGADRVSLKALPRSGAGDALLLILYGFEEIAGEHSVTGSALIKAAEKSGVRLDRLDRTIDAELVTAAGMRRAKRYGLNNRGKQRAQEILKTVLD
jgi:hypothetical protein